MLAFERFLSASFVAASSAGVSFEPSSDAVCSAPSPSTGAVHAAVREATVSSTARAIRFMGRPLGATFAYIKPKIGQTSNRALLPGGPRAAVGERADHSRGGIGGDGNRDRGSVCEALAANDRRGRRSRDERGRRQRAGEARITVDHGSEAALVLQVVDAHGEHGVGVALRQPGARERDVDRLFRRRWRRESRSARRSSDRADSS